MDSENFFARLRKLAVEVETKTCLYQERCEKPPGERPVNDSSMKKLLMDIQHETHKLKETANKELKMQEDAGGPFKDILIACNNLLRVREQQAMTLKAHLVQYGYQPLPSQEPKPAKKKAPNSEHEDMQADSLEDTAKGEPLAQETGTPSKRGEAEATEDLNRTPKMEDFGLCSSRINLHLKTEASTRKTLVGINQRMSSENTAVCPPNGREQNWEDLTSNRVSEAGPVMTAHIPQTEITSVETRPESCEPQSPNLSSWFLQNQNKPPSQPVMLHRQQGDTVTPSSPDCLTTDIASIMPQEPRRLVDAMDAPGAPVEPSQCYHRDNNPTPEQPDMSYVAGHNMAQHLIATPSHKRGPAHLAFLQDDGTPKTPELTMSIGNFGVKPRPQAIVAPAIVSSNTSHYSSSAVPSSNVATQPFGVAAQPSSVAAQPSRITTSQEEVGQDMRSDRSHQVIAAITKEEHQSLSASLRNRVSLEQVNEWVWLLDVYLTSKPFDQRYLSPSDLSRLQGSYPWLKATLLYLVTYNRLEKEQQSNGEIFYMPFMRRKLDFS